MCACVYVRVFICMYVCVLSDTRPAQHKSTNRPRNKRRPTAQQTSTIGARCDCRRRRAQRRRVKYSVISVWRISLSFATMVLPMHRLAGSPVDCPERSSSGDIRSSTRQATCGRNLCSTAKDSWRVTQSSKRSCSTTNETSSFDITLTTIGDWRKTQSDDRAKWL